MGEKGENKRLEKSQPKQSELRSLIYKEMNMSK